MQYWFHFKMCWFYRFALLSFVYFEGFMLSKYQILGVRCCLVSLEINVWTFEFRCNFYRIDLIRKRIIYRDRIWKSRVQFSFAKKLKKLIFLYSKNFEKMFIANSNCAICSICSFSCWFVTLSFSFRLYYF